MLAYLENGPSSPDLVTGELTERPDPRNWTFPGIGVAKFQNRSATVRRSSSAFPQPNCFLLLSGALFQCLTTPVIHLPVVYQSVNQFSFRPAFPLASVPSPGRLSVPAGSRAECRVCVLCVGPPDRGLNGRSSSEENTLDPTGMHESSESYKSVTLKSCGDTSVTEPSVESSSRSMHGDGIRVRFPSSAVGSSVGENQKFPTTGRPPDRNWMDMKRIRPRWTGNETSEHDGFWD